MANIDLLEQLRYMRGRCEWLEKARTAAVEDVARLKAIDYSAARVSGGTVHDVSDLLIQAEAREERYFKAWHEQESEYREALAKADKTLALLPDPIEVQVLYDFYLQGKRMTEIAGSLYFSRQYTYEIRKRAVNHYNELMFDKE